MSTHSSRRMLERTKKKERRETSQNSLSDQSPLLAAGSTLSPLIYWQECDVQINLIPSAARGAEISSASSLQESKYSMANWKKPQRPVLIQPDTMPRWETNVTRVLDPNNPLSSRPPDLVKAAWTAWAEPQFSHQGFELHLNGPFLIFIQVWMKSSLSQVPAWTVNNLLQPLYKAENYMVLLKAINPQWLGLLPCWMEIV